MVEALKEKKSLFLVHYSVTDNKLFKHAFDSFTEETGIIVTYTGSENFEQEIQIQMESGDTPDFALWPQPGGVVDAAERGLPCSFRRSRY